jgi:hypothetical protein
MTQSHPFGGRSLDTELVVPAGPPRGSVVSVLERR